MTDVQVLDQSQINLTMTPKITSQQRMYTFNIPANTLSNESRLRIKLKLSRVVGTPLNNSTFTCEICHDDALPGAQELSEVATLIANPNETAGSFAFVDAINGETEIYQVVYVPTDTFNDTFDNSPALKLYKIRETDTTQIAKILTTTTDDLNAGNFIVGIADEPVYAIYFGVSFFSTAPSGLYLYLAESRAQYFIPQQGSGSFSYFTLLNNKVYVIEDTGVAPSNILYQMDLTGAVIASSSVLPDAGFTNITAYQAFGDFLYVLSQNTIIKISLANFSIAAQYPLGRTACRALAVVSTNLIYIFYGNISIAYLDLGSGTVTDVDTNVSHTTGLSFNDGVVFPIKFNLFFQKIDNNLGYLYLGTDASAHILKIGPIGCP